MRWTWAWVAWLGTRAVCALFGHGPARSCCTADAEAIWRECGFCGAVISGERPAKPSAIVIRTSERAS